MTDILQAELAESKVVTAVTRMRFCRDTYGSQGLVLDFINPEMVTRRNRNPPGRIPIRDREFWPHMIVGGRGQITNRSPSAY